MQEEGHSYLEQVSKEATDWLVLLQEEPDEPALWQRFERWLAVAPENREAWAATQRTAGLIAELPAAHAPAWRPHLARRPAGATPARPAPPPRRRSRGASLRRPALALGALVAACLLLLLAPSALLQLRADYRAGTAEILSLLLEDGSSVVLAPESAIAVRYGAAQRQVTLLAGEAFFEVAHEDERTFRVQARSLEVSVLGTAFDLRRDAEGASVAVARGLVQVEQHDGKAALSERLASGETLNVTWTGEAVRGRLQPSQVAAWRRHRLIVEDVPLGEVVARVHPYFAGRILVADRSLAGLPVTGIYDLSRPQDALRAIARAHGGRVRQITPWLLVVARL